MKITGIDIGDYRQFKNIKFDFTYPADHHDPEKAGKPLDKVCFIGQSGTGKTTLLNIIWSFFLISDDGYQLYKRRQLGRPNSVDPYIVFNEVSVTADANGKYIRFDNGNFKNYEDSLFKDLSVINSSVEWLLKSQLENEIEATNKLCVYIDDSAINHAYSLTANRNESNFGDKPYIANSNEILLANEKREETITKLINSKVMALQSIGSHHLWNYLLSDIDRYDESLKKIAIDLIQRNGSFSPNRLAERLNKWQEDNPNPKIDIANNCLDPILKSFYLEVDTEGTEAPIVIKTRNGISLTYDTLSTGTKQLLATAIPIYKSQVHQGVILFDEPERSLFPDIQRGLIDYYTSLAPEAQFFFATHSPIIASAFEPCERFILSFNENGEIECHSGVAPEGDDPNDILRQDFAMADLMLQKGLEEYERYLDLSTKIKNEKDIDRKMELIAERSVIGNKYNFPVTNSNEKN